MSAQGAKFVVQTRNNDGAGAVAMAEDLGLQGIVVIVTVRHAFNFQINAAKWFISNELYKALFYSTIEGAWAVEEPEFE